MTKTRLTALLFATTAVLATDVAQALPTDQHRVRSVLIGDGIASWQARGPSELTIDLPNTNRFLITFRRPCRGLENSSHLGLSASDRTVYAGFDFVTVGNERCVIRSIEKLGR